MTARSTWSSAPSMARPCCCRNVNPDHHHWVELKLIGGAKGPRDAVGATVYLTANGMRQRQDVHERRQLCLDQRPAASFGLGDATDAGTAEIHWPSGTSKETDKLPAVDRIYTITEGKGITGALCGGQTCPTRCAAHLQGASHEIAPAILVRRLASLAVCWVSASNVAGRGQQARSHRSRRSPALRRLRPAGARPLCRRHRESRRPLSAPGSAHLPQIPD